MASRIAKVIDAVAGRKDRVLEGQSDLVQAARGDIDTPNEIGDINNVFLVRFGSKNNRRAPGAKIFYNPTITFYDFKMRHDNLALMGPKVWLLAADRWRSTRINSKFKVKT